MIYKPCKKCGNLNDLTDHQHDCEIDLLCYKCNHGIISGKSEVRQCLDTLKNNNSLNDEDFENLVELLEDTIDDYEQMYSKLTIPHNVETNKSNIERLEKIRDKITMLIK